VVALFSLYLHEPSRRSTTLASSADRAVIRLPWVGLAPLGHPEYPSAVDGLYDIWYTVLYKVHLAEATSKGNHVMTQKKGRIGSSFEGYLADQGTLEETNTSAVKRVLAWQLEQAMEKKQISKSAMARAMRTSRSQLDRILDPDNDHIRLDTLTAAANVLGLNLRIELVG